MLCEREGDLYHLSMNRRVRVCFSATQFVIGMISCMHLSAFVSENELQKRACMRKRERLIQSHSLCASAIDPKAVLVNRQVAHEARLMICHEAATH